MFICICRNLRESEFKSEQELKDRLLQDDYCCGKCIEDINIPNNQINSNKNSLTNYIHCGII